MMVDRKYSDPNTYDNSIDFDDAADGSEGGYTKNGNYINPNAMMELVRLRDQLATLEAELKAEKLRADKAECAAYQELATHCRSLEAENAKQRETIKEQTACIAELEDSEEQLQADLAEALELLKDDGEGYGPMEMDNWIARRDALLKRRGEG